MIDLHCHLLPGIDDGPETMEEAVALAAHAVRNGIVRAVVTPHVHVGRYGNEFASIEADLARFRAELDRRNIPLQLGLGAEVRIGEGIIAMVMEERIPFLGTCDGYRIMLLELPHSHIPLGSDVFVGWLLKQKIRPVIAHPERNKDVHIDIDRITPFVSMGCWLQLTAGSVTGNFGEPSRTRAVQLLERGWVSILATDAHNLLHRPPELEPGRRAAALIVGEEESWKLVRDAPLAIVGGNVSSPCLLGAG
jgi:protein-tyrosine phosphatase